MPIRFFSIALSASIAGIAYGGMQSLSSPGDWGEDFTSRSPATAECPGGSLTHLDTRMTVSAPNTLERFRTPVPDPIRSNVVSTDRLHLFQYTTHLDSGDYWGFSGYLVARGDCIVHAQVTGYDN